MNSPKANSSRPTDIDKARKEDSLYFRKELQSLGSRHKTKPLSRMSSSGKIIPLYNVV